MFSSAIYISIVEFSVQGFSQRVELSEMANIKIEK